jgi:phosphatidylserine/phosphatidylglycerophosphate/cardiolipin synthase-like enzyme
VARSTNFDNRSFRLNDEASVNLFEPAFAARATAVFEADIERSQRVTLEQWERRPWRERLKEEWAMPFASQLSQHMAIVVAAPASRGYPRPLRCSGCIP